MGNMNTVLSQEFTFDVIDMFFVRRARRKGIFNEPVFWAIYPEITSPDVHCDKLKKS